MRELSRKPLRNAAFSALALHGAFFLCLLISIHPFDQPRPLTPKGALHTYLYNAASLRSTPRVEARIPLPKLMNAPPLAKSIDPVASPVSERDSSASKPPMVAGDTKSSLDDALLTLLHDAIQVEQRYPASARAMHRTGRVIVSFILAPDGSIDELKLVQTSGTASLDDAALAAVQTATPFQGVAAYVQASTPFQLALNFELPT